MKAVVRREGDSVRVIGIELVSGHSGREQVALVIQGTVGSRIGGFLTAVNVEMANAFMVVKNMGKHGQPDYYRTASVVMELIKLFNKGSELVQ
jgi:hypothetical protein